MYPHRKLLIYEENLNPNFFDLSTGLAGDILQKLVNYSVQTAIVLNSGTHRTVRFKVLIYLSAFLLPHQIFPDPQVR